MTPEAFGPPGLAPGPVVLDGEGSSVKSVTCRREGVS
jgi:hypothetical protein